MARMLLLNMLENDPARLNLNIMYLFFMVKSLANPAVGLLLLAGLDILCMPEPVLTQRLQHFSTSVRRKTLISCIMTFENINISNITFHILTQQDFKIQNQQGQVTRFDRAQALSALLHLQLVVYIA